MQREPRVGNLTEKVLNQLKRMKKYSACNCPPLCKTGRCLAAAEVEDGGGELDEFSFLWRGVHLPASVMLLS